MPESLLVVALGGLVRIDLSGLSDTDAAAVRAAWRDALAPSPAVVPGVSPRVVERAKRDETPLVSAAHLGPDQPTMLETLSQRVTLAALEQRRGELWMLHAAGIAAEDGRVIVLVGPSGRGKTTAARTLSAHFGYVSDESVAIDADGRVWPYRKPLSVIEQPGAPKAQRSPSDLGLGELPTQPLHLAAVVLLDRAADGPESATVEDVDLGDALEELVAQSSYLTAMPTPLRTMASLAASAGGIRRVRYQDASSLPALAHSLLATLATPSAPTARGSLSERSPRGSLSERSETKRPEPRADPAPSLYSRTPYVDALDLADPDRLAVLHAGERDAGMLHVLAGVAPALWRAADAASVSTLSEAAIAAYGVPDGDPGTLVGAAVDALVEAGLLGTDRWWRIRDDVAWVGEDERVVVLGLADSGGSPLALEGSAAVIWHALGEREWRTTDAVIDAVAQIAVERADVEGDVAVFLESLATMGLIERA